MLGTRALSSVVVVMVGVVPALFGPWGVAAAFAVLGAIALMELVAMFARLDYRVLWPVALAVALVALVAAAAAWPGWVFSGIVALALFSPACVLIFRSSLDGTLNSWMATSFTALYLAIPLGHIVAVRHLTGATGGAGAWLTRLEADLGQRGTALGLAWFLLALIATWLSDVSAYAVGKTLGRHRMTPILSPNKTWEGFAGGIVGAVVIALIANWLFGIGMRVVVSMLVGLVIALAATAGDLAESLIKRQTGVKDTGTIIPGHGGVLDRLDSQLFVFVAVYYAARLVG